MCVLTGNVLEDAIERTPALEPTSSLLEVGAKPEEVEAALRRLVGG